MRSRVGGSVCVFLLRFLPAGGPRGAAAPLREKVGRYFFRPSDRPTGPGSPRSDRLHKHATPRSDRAVGDGDRVGLLLPVYLFQTAATVIRYHHRWSIRQELLPRNLFQGLTKPLLFALFTKEHRRTLHGFFLYTETDALLAGVHPRLRAYLIGNLSTAQCWRDAVRVALEACGGRATLSELYACFESGGRPTTNQFWREKVRQIAGKHYHRIAPGEYALAMGDTA